MLATALIAPLLLGQQVTPRAGAYREEARVERVIVDAYVTDNHGEPIANLTAPDFDVRVDGIRVPVESADWIAADVAEVASLPLLPLEGEALEALPDSPYPPGRLLIFFFQTNYEPSRLTGLVRMGLQAHRLVRTLLPTDRVAVFSIDSHVKLRQDFTSDHDKLNRAIDQSILTGKPPAPDSDSQPSLSANFDFAAARKAITPERALMLIARAAAEIPGAKSMLYFGWGLGTIGGMSGPVPAERRDYTEALRRLAKARISIFTLDVTDADYHTLEGTLRVVSDLTGGLYQKTHIFPGLAMDRVRRLISGRYVLVLRRPEMPHGVHMIRVELAGRKGSVSAREYYED